jgi:hypothetical protein
VIGGLAGASTGRRLQFYLMDRHVKPGPTPATVGAEAGIITGEIVTTVKHI